jgi:hypothetical protein
MRSGIGSLPANLAQRLVAVLGRFTTAGIVIKRCGKALGI